MTRGIAGLDRSEPLAAVSPLDGRYADRTGPLVPHASEAALIRARARVEVEYLLALADLPAVPLELSGRERAAVRGVHEGFDAGDARLVKRLETAGAAGYPATNHDVKAVEYFLRVRFGEVDTLDADALAPWIHFGLTSEDVNNLAERLLVRGAVESVLEPAIREVRDELARTAREHRDVPMLARTHGQPATPTTFGKEMAVYAARLGRAEGRLGEAVDGLAGKLAGASGTYAAHEVAYPEVDWRAFARKFVGGLGFEHLPLATQVNPCDDLAAVFDALRAANGVLLDLDRDAWLYVSDRYLGQSADGDGTGSSTMPHKVNPIDFENSEGNLSKANSDLSFLSEYLTTSRLQRDLSDSTVKRNVGAAFGHCLIGYTKVADGLASVAPDEAAMRDDLEANPAVIGEAVQTLLRREGYADAYERVKEATRGREVDPGAFDDLLADLDVDESTRAAIRDLTPAGYTGLAGELVDELDERE